MQLITGLLQIKMSGPKNESGLSHAVMSPESAKTQLCLSTDDPSKLVSMHIPPPKV